MSGSVNHLGGEPVHAQVDAGNEPVEVIFGTFLEFAEICVINQGCRSCMVCLGLAVLSSNDPKMRKSEDLYQKFSRAVGTMSGLRCLNNLTMSSLTLVGCCRLQW